MQPLPLIPLVRQRKRRRDAVRQGLQRRAARMGLGCGAAVFLALIATMVLVSAAYVQTVTDLPSPEELPRLLDPQNGLLMQPTRLYDRNGQALLLSLENPGIPRRYAYFDPEQPPSISSELVRATVGTIEPGFWGSPGFSLEHLTSPQPRTIAEVLVNDLLLRQELPNLRRALRMRMLAAQTIARYGHAQVIEWYLNSVSYGHLAYGADSAARLYLDKPPSTLTLADAALLVAASQAPALNPLDAPDAALERQRKVLETMLVNGTISQADFVQAVTNPPRLVAARAFAQGATSASPAEAFAWLVVDQLYESFGRERMERGGLRIITTLDYRLQLELTCLTLAQLGRLTGQENTAAQALLPDGSPCEATRLLPTIPPGQAALQEGLTASAAILDPQTGQVLALLGDTTRAGESAAFTPRDPGSLLSPFVTLAALARGYSPGSLVWDVPLEEGAVEESSAIYHGPVRLRVAAANDYLAPQAELLRQFGPGVVWRLAGTLGLASLADETSADILYGGGRATPLEIAQAYGVFAASGQRAGQRPLSGGALEPAVALYVEEREGDVLLDARQVETQAIVSPQLAHLVHHIYSDTVTRRESLGYPNPLEIGRPSGAKIGRTQDRSAAWTAGYTKRRAVVVWIGMPGGGDTVVPARAAADLWYAAMQYSNRDLPVEDWQEPSGIVSVEVCDPSGMLPTEACPAIVREVFLTGNEPNTQDTLYQEVQINRETGRLATVFTPIELIDEQTFLIVPPRAQQWAQLANLPAPPDEYDSIQPPQPSPDARITSPQRFGFLKGEVRIEGTAAGADFQHYQLQVGQGINPQTWIQVGSDGTEPVEGGVLGVWDPQDAEGLYVIRLLVVREDQSIETDTIQVTVDATPPTLVVQAPLQGEEIQRADGEVLPLRVEASDPLGLERVEWWIDGKLVETRVAEPYTMLWEPTVGPHTLEVRAFDRAGNERRSEEIQFLIAD